MEKKKIKALCHCGFELATWLGNLHSQPTTRHGERGSGTHPRLSPHGLATENVGVESLDVICCQPPSVVIAMRMWKKMRIKKEEAEKADDGRGRKGWEKQG